MVLLSEFYEFLKKTYSANDQQMAAFEVEILRNSEKNNCTRISGASSLLK